MNNEDLKAFVDGELPPWKHWLVARKVAGSPELQAEVEALRKLSEDLATLDLPEVPLSDSLRARLLATAPEPTPVLPTPRRSPAKALALGLVGASVLAVAVVVLNPRSQNLGASSKMAAPAVSDAVVAQAEGAASAPAASAPMQDSQKRVDGSVTLKSSNRMASPPGMDISRTESRVYANPAEKPARNQIADKLDSNRANFRRETAAKYGLRFKDSEPADSTAANQKGTVASRAIRGVEQKEVIELAAGPDSESLIALRKRVEKTVVENGGKVLKQEPLQVTLPPALRDTARQKLTALVTSQSAKERKRSTTAMTESQVEQRLKVTVYFKD